MVPGCGALAAAPCVTGGGVRATHTAGGFLLPCTLPAAPFAAQPGSSGDLGPWTGTHGALLCCVCARSPWAEPFQRLHILVTLPHL